MATHVTHNPPTVSSAQLWTPNLFAQIIYLAQLQVGDVAAAVGVPAYAVRSVLSVTKPVSYKTCERLISLCDGAGLRGVDAALLLRQVTWQAEYGTCDLTVLAAKLEVARRAREWVMERSNGAATTT